MPRYRVTVKCGGPLSFATEIEAANKSDAEDYAYEAALAYWSAHIAEVCSSVDTDAREIDAEGEDVL